MVLDILIYATAALVAAGVVLYGVGLVNQMITSAREVDRHFANVEVSLKQRYDELPRLVEICRGFIAHERALLERVTLLRARFDEATATEAKVETANELEPTVDRLIALAEDYPELRANDLFLRLAERLSELEDEIADRRELFNASVVAYNTFIEIVPQRFLARPLGFAPKPFLELETS